MPLITTNLYLAKEMRPDSSPDYLMGATLRGFQGMYHAVTGDLVDIGPAFQVAEYAEAEAFRSTAQAALEATDPFKAHLKDLTDRLARIPTLAEQKRAQAAAYVGMHLMLDYAVTDRKVTKTGLYDMDEFLSGTDATPLSRVGLGHLEGFIRERFILDLWRIYRRGELTAHFAFKYASRHQVEGLDFSESDVPRVAKAFNAHRPELTPDIPTILKDAVTATNARLRPASNGGLDEETLTRIHTVMAGPGRKRPPKP